MVSFLSFKTPRISSLFPLTINVRVFLFSIGTLDKSTNWQADSTADNLARENSYGWHINASIPLFDKLLITFRPYHSLVKFCWVRKVLKLLIFLSVLHSEITSHNQREWKVRCDILQNAMTLRCWTLTSVLTMWGQGVLVVLATLDRSFV